MFSKINTWLFNTLILPISTHVDFVEWWDEETPVEVRHYDYEGVHDSTFTAWLYYHIIGWFLDKAVSHWQCHTYQENIKYAEKRFPLVHIHWDRFIEKIKLDRELGVGIEDSPF